MNDLGLGKIEDDINYNFKHKYDEENEIILIIYTPVNTLKCLRSKINS